MGRRLEDPKFRRKCASGGGRRRKHQESYRRQSAKAAVEQLAALVNPKVKGSKGKKGRKRKIKAGNPEDEKSEGEGEDEEDVRRRQAQKAQAAGVARAGFEKDCDPDTPLDTPFKSRFWLGAVPEGEPDQALKLLRKSLGVKVRGSPAPPPVQTVADAGLPACFQKVFSGKQGGGLGLEKPTPIQAQVWPAALSGLDVVGIAPTGSGKTLAYLLPAVPHILGNQVAPPPSLLGKAAVKKQGLTCLVLVPTRELARQIGDVCGGNSTSGWLKKHFGLRAVSLYGGQGKEIQLDTMVTLGQPQIVGATPGRLLELLGLGIVSLQDVTYLVLDEADRMLALGFEPQLSSIVQSIRPNRQVLMFSATFPGKLQEAAEKWMANARVTVRVSTFEDVAAKGDGEAEEAEGEGDDESEKNEAESEAEKGARDADAGSEAAKDGEKASARPRHSTLTVSPTIHQTVKVCPEHKRLHKLINFLQRMRKREKASGTRQRAAVLIFCNEIKTLRAVASALEKRGERSAPLHSQLAQERREAALADLKSGVIDTLVATDLASRGLHIGRLKHVVNYDFPNGLELYCHRIGRVGRSGVEGWSLSFIGAADQDKQLAPGLVSLLQRSGQTVRASLQGLADGLEATPEEDSLSDDSEMLQEGAVVRIKGLRNAAELNGCKGRVCRHLAEAGRWEVVLDGRDYVTKSLKAENLEVLEERKLGAEEMHTGCLVVIHSLKAVPHLNGVRARARKPVVGTDRWEVIPEGTDDVKSVRLENLAEVAGEDKRAGKKQKEAEKEEAEKNDDEVEKDEEDEEEKEEDLAAKKESGDGQRPLEGAAGSGGENCSEEDAEESEESSFEGSGQKTQQQSKMQKMSASGKRLRRSKKQRQREKNKVAAKAVAKVAAKAVSKAAGGKRKSFLSGFFQGGQKN